MWLDPHLLGGKEMANLPTSLAIQTSHVRCKARAPSKLRPFSKFICGTKIHCLDKMSNKETNLVCCQLENVMNHPNRNLSTKVNSVSRVSVGQTEWRRSATFTEVEDLRKASTYQFRTECGDQLKVYVRKKNDKYSVCIEVVSLQLHDEGNMLLLSWGMCRGDLSCFIRPDVQGSTADARTGMNLTPFMQSSNGRFVVELEFDAKEVPFYFSFLLRSSLNAQTDGSEIRSHRKTKFGVPVGFLPGHPDPLGLSFSPDGSKNFSIFSCNAKSVILCLFEESTLEKPALELDLDPYINRSGDIWHVSFESAWNFVSYGYRFKGNPIQSSKDKNHENHIIMDPYAKIIWNSYTNGPETGFFSKYLGRLCNEPAFEWGEDLHPNLSTESLIMYRLNVARFTQHTSSKLPSDLAGTFSGLTEKLQHLKDLGANAVLLEPITTFDESTGPYLPCHFFSPMNIYGPSGGFVSAINSMKEMVKSLHANGMEVLMEVIFTHTAEVGALQGIDDPSYYYEKCTGDTKLPSALNCNYPIVQQLILDSLRHWVTEFHVDGFCFMNASSLLRGFHGEYLSRPPLVEAIAFDPLLSKTKIIADCWDPFDMVTNDTRFPHWKRWAGINASFCNDIRNFLRGESHISNLATRLCGSGDIFSVGRGPAFSFNFISRNFGLPLVDLVSFSGGDLAAELSWNCGEEGPTNNTAVLERRLKQIRNFLFILFISLGVPVLNMGDECGQSSGGSTAYSDRKPFNWDALKTSFGTQMTQFISFLSSLRKRRSDLLQRRNFLEEENIDWHGSNQSPPRWEDPSCKFLALTLKADKVESTLNSKSSNIQGDVYIAFNAAGHSETLILPPSPEGMSWCCLVDTALPYPGFFSAEGEPPLEQMAGLIPYEIKPHSCTMFEARS